MRYRMNNSDEAEDVVSEAFMLAARSFDKFDPSRAKFATWVTTIALNCMNSYYRKAHPTIPIEEITEDSVSSSDEWQDGYSDRDLAQHLLGELDDTERELVLLKYQEGLRNVDIADRLGMNASTVSTKLAHALAKMRPLAEKGLNRKPHQA